MNLIARNFVFPWLPLVGIIFLAWALAGCATVYEVERNEGGVVTKARIVTRREFEGPVVVKYNRERGEFEFQSGAVSAQVSPLEQAAANIISALPALLAPMPTVPE